MTEALSAHVLSSLVALAARRPLKINGLRMSAEHLQRLAEEAGRSRRPVWIGDASTYAEAAS